MQSLICREKEWNWICFSRNSKFHFRPNPGLPYPALKTWHRFFFFDARIQIDIKRASKLIMDSLVTNLPKIAASIGLLTIRRHYMLGILQHLTSFWARWRWLSTQLSWICFSGINTSALIGARKITYAHCPLSVTVFEMPMKRFSQGGEIACS